MITSAILIVFALLALVLGAYAFYNGKKASNVNWSFLRLAVIVVVWDVGIAMYSAKISQTLSGIGMIIAEVCIAITLPLLTDYFMYVLKRKSRNHKRVMFAQFIAGAVIIVTVFTKPYLGVTLENGVLDLFARPGWTLALAVLFSAALPLYHIYMLVNGLRRAAYKRDRSQAFAWIITMAGCIVLLLTRFFIDLEYESGIGCYSLSLMLLMLYNFAHRYDTGAINALNMAEYFYSTINTPFLVVNP
ncbi:MAG: hypothetical protein LBN97_07000, partial [Oscillospiraceae bacterium]|nr:hypothetical protein [Oscillospiraceae bacterium]